MEKYLTKISKFLSFVLRHKPDAIGLTLDPEGWADIDELIAKADISIDHDLLNQVVAQNDKKRFAMSPDGQSIRANQGHSLQVDLGLMPTEPPAQLFHGTADRFLNTILAQGLSPQNRQYVHLSADAETATNVGQRHGRPVILTLPAHDMHVAGHPFYIAQNGVWLTDHVPAENLTVLKT
jgi:putative RNA 2'-phosphotransferase